MIGLRKALSSCRMRNKKGVVRRSTSRRCRPAVANLEERRLMSVGFQDFTVPPSSFGDVVADIVPSPGGALWFTETPEAILTDFTGPTPKALARITTGGVSSVYDLGAGVGVDSIAPAPDGSLWFTTYKLIKNPSGVGRTSVFQGIDRIGPDGRLTKLVTDKPIGSPDSLKVGADGNIWVLTANTLDGHPSDFAGRTFDRITPAGAVTKYNAPNARRYDFAIGPDGSVWFAGVVDPARGKFGPPGAIERLSPDGRITDYPLPAGYRDGAGAILLTAGPDGNIWFADGLLGQTDGADGRRVYKSAIGKITPTGSIAEYPISANAYVSGLGAGPDNDLYYTQYFISPGVANHPGPFVPKIGRITTGGSITEIVTPFPTDVTGPIATGPDGNLWFGYFPYQTQSTGRIERLIIPRPQVVRVDRVNPPNLSIQFVVTFSTGLDSARAEDLANYTLTAIGPGGRPGPGVRLDSAIYDPASRSVTIRVHGPLDPRLSYRLTVDGRSGHGLRSPEGFRLAGVGAGRAGTDSSTIIPRA